MGDVQYGSKVDGDELFPEFGLALEERHEQIPADVVDQDIDRPKIGFDAGHQVARGSKIRQIDGIGAGRAAVFTVFTGSGKSSLVFGMIAAESQRLINETYPAFVQQFLLRYGQPDVDLLENISDAIIVDQQRLAPHTGA